MRRDIKDRLREVTAFFRFETGDRVAAAASLSEEAACCIETLEEQVNKLEAKLSQAEYFLQDKRASRLEPRVIDIAYTAWHLGQKGKNPDGGPCDWFNDTLPRVVGGIDEIRRVVGFEVES